MLSTVFGEYKNLQQRQEMEKEQLKKLSPQQSVSSKPVVDENQLPDIPVTISDKIISSEGGSVANKESSNDKGDTLKVPEERDVYKRQDI